MADLVERKKIAPLVRLQVWMTFAFVVGLAVWGIDLFYGVIELALDNVFGFLINSFLLWYSIQFSIRIWGLSAWRQIFPDTGKLGQKIEWYDKGLKHLKPHTKKVFLIRVSVIFVVTIFLLTLDNTFFYGINLLGFTKLFPVTVDAHFAYGFISGAGMDALAKFLEFTLILYVLLYVEGRSRKIASVVEKVTFFRERNLYRVSMPEVDFDPNSKEFNLCFFAKFKKADGSDSLSPTQHEEWVRLGKGTTRTNLLAVAPIGSGKTQAIIKPMVRQAIAWQARNAALKATMSIFDPKAELAKEVIETAKAYGREDDLCILSSNSDCKYSTNVIRVDNIWDDSTSWKVAGWIINAWQLYQGKTSPEPYWESQSHLLIRNIIALQYLLIQRDLTIACVSKTLSAAFEGCFTEHKGKKNELQKVTEFGMIVIRCLCITTENKDDAFLVMDNYTIEAREDEEFTEEMVELAKDRIEHEKQEYFDEHGIENPEEIEAALIAIKNKVSPLGEDLYSKDESDLKEKLIKQKGALKKKEEEWEKRYKTLLMQEKVYEEALITREKIRKDVGDDSKFAMVLSEGSDVVSELIKWSQSTSDNKYSVISSMRPFLMKFQAPSLTKVLSSKDANLNFDEIIDSGTILVPNFPGVEIGEDLASAIISLVKSRWQFAVLFNTQSTERPKVQIMEEAQRIINISNENSQGDLEYLELSRSFGGFTLMVSQSISALKAKASSYDNWNKIHGTIRTIICFPTNDTNALSEMKKIAGKKVVNRVSRTIQEGASSPELDQLSEKYESEKSTMSVSYTKSESLEDKIHEEHIQNGEKYTSTCFFYDGNKTSTVCLSHRPDYWKTKRDKWSLMKKYDFDYNLRNSFFNKLLIWFFPEGDGEC